VSLAIAVGKKTEEAKTFESRRGFSLSLSKRDGTFSKLIHLDLKFEPLKVAILDSGKFVVLGVDTLNEKPVLAFLDSDGTYLRPIDLDSRPMEESAQLHEIYKRTETSSGSGKMLMAATALGDFAPYGEKVLFYQSGSNLPVHVIGEGGEENVIKVALPKGFALESILAAEKNQIWTVRSRPLSGFADLENKGISNLQDQELIEVDPLTGEARDIVHVTGVFAGQIACAMTDHFIAPRLLNPDKSTDDPGGWFLSVQRR
jgi:hypothetical protein